MLIIINGSIGVGKTSVAWKLNELIDRSVMLDGDFIAGINPFDFSNPKNVNYLYKTMCHLINFHRQNGFQHFIINYVFESENELQKLVDLLQEPIKIDCHCFLLECNPTEQNLRIQRRNSGQMDWELKRSQVLNSVLNHSSSKGFIGKRIETSKKSVLEVSLSILETINLDPLTSKSE